MRVVTGKQRRHLRALGQRLTATLHVGHEGVSEAVVQQAEALLEAHELVKVRVGGNAPEDRWGTAATLARRTGGAGPGAGADGAALSSAGDGADDRAARGGRRLTR
jgi:RNA-binding protein